MSAPRAAAPVSRTAESAVAAEVFPPAPDLVGVAVANDCCMPADMGA
ncbi:hypothetical protein [Streptomyces nodosus]